MSKFNHAIKFNGGMRICEASIAELKFIDAGFCHILHFPIIPRSTSKIVEWEKKKRAKRIKNVLQCPMC